MVTLIFSTLYFLLPAYAANMTPVFVSRLNFLPRLAKPIDGGYKFFGQYLFGSNKTWRGLLLGIIAAMFVGYIQFFLWQFNVIRVNSVIDFAIVDPLFFGLVGGIGALGGDLLKSFIKRRVNIKSGQPWPVFDQLDFIVGYLAITALFVGWHVSVALTALIMTLILHPLANILAYFLRIKKVWW